MRVFTTYQTATIITKHGYRKIRPLKTQDGQFRYQIKDLTDNDYLAFEGEDNEFTSDKIEDLLEPGGWMVLDGFTASAVKQVYEALGAEGRAKFDRVPFQRIAAFSFSRCT